MKGSQGGITITKPCAHCLKSITRYTSQANGKSKNFYCSGSDCQAKWKSANFTPANKGIQAPDEVCERTRIACLKRSSTTKYGFQVGQKWSIARYNDRQLDREFTITKEEFIELAVTDCHYCGTPSKNVGHLGSIRGVLPSFAGINGVDRLDSSKGHTKSNCVSCCWTCNRAKLQMSEDEFRVYVLRLRTWDQSSSVTTLGFTQTQFSVKINNIRQRAKKAGLSYSLTRNLTTSKLASSCYYCGEFSKLGSGRSVAGMSGLDRVDNDRGYDDDNTVPCCMRCNSAKGDMTNVEFQAWIDRVHNHMLSSNATWSAYVRLGV